MSAPPPPPSDGGTPPPPPPPPGGGTPPPPPAGGSPAPAGGYSVSNAFNFGWTKFQQNIGPWLLACLIAIGVYVVVYAIFILLLIPTMSTSTTNVETSGGTIEFTSTSGGIASAIITMIMFVVLTLVGWIIAAQFVRAALGVTDQGRIELGTFFQTKAIGIVVIAALILTGVQLVLGIIGLIPILGWIVWFVGSIVVAFFAQFYMYFALQDDGSGLDAIKSSFAFVNGNLASIVVLYLASLVTLVIGALLCGIGLFVAIPVVAAAHAYTFRTLRGEPVAA